MKLSVITVNLNNATGLLKTVESVINQTFRDFEFIIIDGGSKDSSVEIINQFSQNLNYWISEPDSGIYNAMNKGILQAKGEYCFFLNSGDYFVNENALQNFFKNYFSEDVVMGNMFVCLNRKIIGKCRGKEKLTFIDVYDSIIKHQASFIKRTLFSKYGIYDESLKIVADYEFFLRTIGTGSASYRYINCDITFFDNAGISNNNDDLVRKEKRTVISRNLPAMMQPDYNLFLKYRNLRIIDSHWLFRWLLKMLSKSAKIFERIFNRK